MVKKTSTEPEGETESNLVNVTMNQNLTYRGKKFEEGKTYAIDPDLVPGWVEHWIMSQAYGNVAEGEFEAEPDPRTVGVEESKKKLLLPGEDREELRDQEGVHTGLQDKETLPHPGSEDNLGDVPLEESDEFEERPPLDSPEEVKFTSSDNVPPVLTGGKTKGKK